MPTGFTPLITMPAPSIAAVFAAGSCSSAAAATAVPAYRSAEAAVRVVVRSSRTPASASPVRIAEPSEPPPRTATGCSAIPPA